MIPKKLSELLESSQVILPDRSSDGADITWYAHPSWEGVFLKDLLSAAETTGAFSYHFVKIMKGSAVLDHDHPEQWELNIVLNGTGLFLLGKKEYPIKPGQVYATPPGVHHTVHAGSEDLSMLAVFVKA